MKSNTEKMDPNAEWVDTMKTCAIHAPTGIVFTDRVYYYFHGNVMLVALENVYFGCFRIAIEQQPRVLLSNFA